MAFFSRNILPRIREVAYVINLHDKNSKGTYVIHYSLKGKAVEYFGSFGIEYIPQKLLNKINDKSITHNIFIIQDNESIMCWFYCITFIEYMLLGKPFLDYNNLFSLNDYKKNYKIICKYFQDEHVKPWV